MASINEYQDKDGNKRYEFQLYMGVNPQTGRKKRTRRRGFKSKKEAAVALSRLEVQAEDYGDTPKENNILFSEVFAEWFPVYQNTVRESTWAKTNKMFENHILPAFGDLRMRTITIDQVQQAVNKWFRFTTAGYRRWYYFTSLLFQFSLKRGYIEKNPAKLVTVPKHEAKAGKQSENFWSRDELATFFNCIDPLAEPEKFTLFWVYAYTGARRSEILALEWSDIDFNKSTLIISKTLSQGVGGHTILNATKTAKGMRTIPLDIKTLQYLKQWHLAQQQQLLMRGNNLNATAHLLVFPNSKGKYKSLDTPHKWLSKIIKDNGLRYISVHGLRHTSVSAMFAAGVPIKEIQNRMGDADVQTVFNTYIHTTEEQDRAAANQLADFLGGSQKGSQVQ
ncbi:tyrosine-type recombinase/integrase [Furfurilactobacillus entadae]|uniref:tyrosine-type recombinase/integrase n=1 Tax=Furfurilactobacillus entadae TaxID=2922307 RepID=UPI0035ECC3A3